MKKNLRMLFLGLAAAAFTGGIAQEAKDLTSLLKNPTMEKGVRGWSVAGQMMTGNKNTGTSHYGFHGMSSSIYQAWNGSKDVEGTGTNGIPAQKYFPALSDSYIMQRLGGLENGTYVFGAYAGAACQGDSLPESYKDIVGVTLFANNAEVAVATNNPESKGLPQWAHTGKYNVAVTLTDQDEKKGYLDLGMRIEGTNANFVMWDNATLYYFGNMSEEQALDEMAKIDFRHSVYDIADTLFTEAALDTLVLHQDTLANFLQVLDDSKKAIEEDRVTAANLWDLNEVLYYHKGLAHGSIYDYSLLKKAIKTVDDILAEPEVWTTSEEEIGLNFLDALQEAADVAKEAYEGREMNRKELEDLRKYVYYSAGYVKLDSVFVAQSELGYFIGEAQMEGAPYTAAQVNGLIKLQMELQDTIEAISDDLYIEDINERKIHPNNLYPYVAKVANAIQEVKDNPMSMEYTKFPIEYLPNEDQVGFVGSKRDPKENNWWAFTSPLYRFKDPVTTFRMTIHGSKESQDGSKYFTLSKLAFYDENGREIDKSKFTITSNADHKDEGAGIEGLLDNDPNTYFHSDWKSVPQGDPYLQVEFPEGISLFQFKMVARDNGRQNQFPYWMTVGYLTPELDRLKSTLEGLKSLHAYSEEQVKNEVGFFEQNFDYVLEAIAKAEALLASEPSEAECKTMEAELSQVRNRFAEAPKTVGLPDPEKEYWIVSALPGFNAQQQLDKALTFHAADSTLLWETAGLDSLEQKFKFEPVMVDDEHFATEDGYIFYFVKNVKKNLYLSGTFANGENFDDNNAKRVKFVEKPDTIRLKSFGAGQWGISIWKEVKKDGKVVKELKGMDMFGHNGGSGANGHIGPWDAAYNSGGAYFIREFSKLPIVVKDIKAGEFKTRCYHFTPGNNIKLTANAECDFENANVKLYNLFGEPIAVDTVMYYGNTAHFITPKDVVECGFGFTAPAGVTEVTLSVSHYVSKLPELVAAYEAAVEAAPVVGDSIGMCKDDAAYQEALEAAEALIAAVPEMPENDETNKTIAEMIKRLEKSVTNFEYNLPVAKKYYYIVSAYAEFEKNSYEMTVYANGTKLAWSGINDVDWSRYWQFEPATKAELMAINYPDSVNAFYIKNVGTQEYFGGFMQDFQGDSDIPMAVNKSAAVPYVVTSLGEGSIVALDTWNKNSKKFDRRIHGKGHANGSGKYGGITYWGSGLGSSSAWRIVEVEYDVTDIDFTEVETEAPVVKGIYDIFGRRVVAPTAPGLYIIDGKKRYIK